MVYPIKSHDDLLAMLENSHKGVNTTFDGTIRVLMSYKGGEYLPSRFPSQNLKYSRASCTYTLKQNGVAKCRNDITWKVAKALLLKINVPKSY